MKKILALALSLALAVAIGVGSTLAWLTDTTDAVTNTFTVGNIDITLEETARDFKMVPGADISKDPKVTVKADSEDCWLFVKVEKSKNLDSFISYGIADGWDELDNMPGVTGVYYRKVTASTNDQPFEVLEGNKVTVKGEDVTKAMMDAITATTAPAPTLAFTAYAVQQHGSDNAAAAWEKILTP